MYFIMSPESEIKTCETVLDLFQKKFEIHPVPQISIFHPLGVGYFFLVLCQI